VTIDGDLSLTVDAGQIVRLASVTSTNPKEWGKAPIKGWGSPPIAGALDGAYAEVSAGDTASLMITRGEESWVVPWRDGNRRLQSIGDQVEVESLVAVRFGENPLRGDARIDADVAAH
jgi:hypothetical protein